MKTIAKTMTVVLSFAAFSAPTLAAGEPPMPPQQGMTGMDEAQMDAHLRQIQEEMLKDFDFMQQIRDARDEKEQTRLKNEWLKAMKNHIKSNQLQSN